MDRITSDDLFRQLEWHANQGASLIPALDTDVLLGNYSLLRIAEAIERLVDQRTPERAADSMAPEQGTPEWARQASDLEGHINVIARQLARSGKSGQDPTHRQIQQVAEWLVVLGEGKESAAMSAKTARAIAALQILGVHHYGGDSFSLNHERISEKTWTLARMLAEYHTASTQSKRIHLAELLQSEGLGELLLRKKD